jgi:hypothetical protein
MPSVQAPGHVGPHLPEEIDTPAVRAAFVDWLGSPVRIGTSGLMASRMNHIFGQLRQVNLCHGIDHVVFCLQRATANNHQGVVYPQDLVSPEPVKTAKDLSPWDAPIHEMGYEDALAEARRMLVERSEDYGRRHLRRAFEQSGVPQTAEGASRPTRTFYGRFDALELDDDEGPVCDDEWLEKRSLEVADRHRQRYSDLSQDEDED